MRTRKGGGRHLAIRGAHNGFAVAYLTLAVLVLAWTGSASAQAGFIQAVPGTARPLCTSITSPVVNQTWCADASGAPGTYLWKVWNGTTYVTVGGGGGGGSAIALNNQTWAAFPNQFFGNDANVTISSAGGVHTLGWAGCLPVSRGGIGLCSGIEGFLPFFDTNSSIGMSILQQTGANTITVHPGSSAVQTIQAHFAGGGAGAALLVKGGDADSGSGAVGGELALRGGDPDGAAAGGGVEINGRPGAPGGNVTSRAGNSTTGQGGLWIGTAGDSASGIGGDSFLAAGAGIGARGGDVNLIPGSGTPSGNVIINGLKYPLVDGTPGQAIVTDGAGVLSFASGGTGTVTGSGTAGTLPIWTGASALGDSGVTDDGTTVVVSSTGGTFDNLTLNEGGLDGSHFGNRNLGGIDTQAVGEQIDLSASSSSQYLGNQITDTGSTNNGVGSQITASGSNNVFLGQVLNDGGLGTVTLIGQGFDLTGEDPLLNSSIVMGEAQADLAISTGSIWLGPVGTRPDLRFYDNNGVAGLKWVGFQAPPVVTTSVSWLLPVADGGNGDCLVTDGAGQLAFSNACAGGGGITSLNGLSAAVQTVAPGSTNINWSSAVATHTFTWTGQLSAARGGTGQDTSAWSALPLVTAGVWSQYAGSSCPGGQAATSISAAGVLTCAGAGTGNVTHTGTLTAGVPVVGNGGADIKSQPGNLTNSVYFASGSGQLAQSVNFFYNSGSNALFLNAPSAAASWGTPSLFAATAATVGSNVGATGPLLNLASSNGTIAAPTASATTNLLGTVDFRGFDGTNSVSGATIKTVVQSAVSSGIIPTNMVFTTTDIGGAKHDALTLRNNGNVILGGKLIGYAGFGATDGALLIGNGAGGRWDANVLSSPDGSISITNGPGTIKLATTNGTGWTNVQTFGVLPANSAGTNTANIVAAVAAACSGTLFFPPGTYSFSGSISVTCANGLTILGSGASATPTADTPGPGSSSSVVTGNFVGPLIAVNTQGAVNVQNLKVIQVSTAVNSMGIQFTGPGGLVGNDGSRVTNSVIVGGDVGIQFLRAAHSVVENTRVQGFGTSIGGGIGIQYSATQNCDNSEFFVINTRVEGPRGQATGILAEGAAVNITGSSTFNVRNGILVRMTDCGSGQMTITGNQIIAGQSNTTGGVGIWVQNVDTGAPGTPGMCYIAIGNNVVDMEAGDQNIYFQSPGTGIFCGVTVTGNTLRNQRNAVPGIRIEQVDGGMFANNVFDSWTGTTNVFFQGGSGNQNVTVLGTQFVRTGRTGYFTGTGYALQQGAPGVPLAELLAWDNGSEVFCTNCKNPSDVGFVAGGCALAGTGNNARRLNGAWICS